MGEVLDQRISLVRRNLAELISVAGSRSINLALPGAVDLRKNIPVL